MKRFAASTYYILTPPPPLSGSSNMQTCRSARQHGRLDFRPTEIISGAILRSNSKSWTTCCQTYPLCLKANESIIYNNIIIKLL